MTQMRLIAMLVCFLAGTSGVPISQNAGLLQSLPVGQQFQPGSPKMLSGPQPHVPNPRVSQSNSNVGVSQHPAQFQYLPYSQQPQFFYYPYLGQQSRNPTQFSYGVPIIQHPTSQQYPANTAPAARPGQNAQQMRPNQPQQQQQVQPIFYMVPHIPQGTAGSYGGLSSEELQNMGRMAGINMHMPAIRGNMFPVSGPQRVVPVGPLRPANTFPATADLQQPGIVAVPPSSDAIPANGGSQPNNGALPGRISSMQERDRAPCVSAEIPLTNSGPLDTGHGTFISAGIPTDQPNPNYNNPNLVPTAIPTPEYDEAVVPAAPPLLSDTVNTNTGSILYP